jgi:hypothetical protein
VPTLDAVVRNGSAGAGSRSAACYGTEKRTLGFCHAGTTGGEKKSQRSHRQIFVLSHLGLLREFNAQN